MLSPAAYAALLSTGLISLAPNLILLLFPNYGRDSEGSPVLSIGQALAAGGLLGDVFLHTLPHAMAGAEGHGGEDIGLIILTGFATFLVLDVMVRSLGGGHHQHHSDSVQNGSHHAKGKVETTTFFSSAVLLNLAADALHNFTDGLAIGASFASSPPSDSILALLQSRGGLAAISVLFHEIPHELGDFAVLVSAGLSKGQAITAQFSTAIAAFVGTIVGIAASSFDGVGQSVLLPFTAGGFVYLASVTILPELLEEKASARLRLAQILAFAAGVAFMQAVAVLEHSAGGHGEHGHSHSHHHHHDDHHHREQSMGGHDHDNAHGVESHDHGHHHSHEL